MSVTELTIEVEPGSELARLLEKANGATMVLVKDGVRYRVTPEELAEEARPEAVSEPDPWADYDPERALAGMLAAAGSWSDIDADKMIEDIYRWREEGSRPWRKEDLDPPDEP
jgi:hypothetical protein